MYVDNHICTTSSTCVNWKTSYIQIKFFFWYLVSIMTFLTFFSLCSFLIKNTMDYIMFICATDIQYMSMCKHIFFTVAKNMWSLLILFYVYAIWIPEQWRPLKDQWSRWWFESPPPPAPFGPPQPSGHTSQVVLLSVENLGKDMAFFFQYQNILSREITLYLPQHYFMIQSFDVHSIIYI